MFGLLAIALVGIALAWNVGGMLARTRVWWVPGALLLLGAIVMLGFARVGGGMAGLGSGFTSLAAVAVGAAGVIAFTVAIATRATPRKPPPLPVATVVRR